MIAQELSLKGSLIQGGLITGNTLPGARIDLSGKKIRVNADGLFVFGFGRDAPAEAVINVLLPDGRRISRVLEIGQRKYRVQRIDGLPGKMVTPSEKALKRIWAEGKAIRRRGTFTPETHFKSGFAGRPKGRISGVYGSQRILNGATVDRISG